MTKSDVLHKIEELGLEIVRVRHAVGSYAVFFSNDLVLEVSRRGTVIIGHEDSWLRWPIVRSIERPYLLDLACVIEQEENMNTIHFLLEDVVEVLTYLKRMLDDRA